MTTASPASWGSRVTLAPLGSSPNEPLAFEGSTLVDPGIYTLRIGVVDSEGRRGSVVREVSAWKMSGEALAFGDLIVGSAATGIRAARGGGATPERRQRWARISSCTRTRRPRSTPRS